MNLNHETARHIRDALTGAYIDVTDYVFDNAFMAGIQKKTDIFYQNPNDTRTKSEIFEDTFNGEVCEHALVDLCRKYHLISSHNDEEQTKEFYWDVRVNDAKIEVKYQGGGRRWFSFSNKISEGHMFTHWSNYDLVVAFYIIHRNQRMFAVPWKLIDNSAIDPNHINMFDGDPFYRQSTVKGRYLHWSADKAGLVAKLNIDENMFTLQAKL